MVSKKLIAISLGLLLSISWAAAQGLGDFALTFSQTNPGGSARILGVGGAQVALGGDVSHVQGNPAGLGFYNKSSFAFTAGLNFINTSSQYIGSTTDDFRNSLTVPNVALVLSGNKSRTNPWRGGTVGISFNRTNNFNNTYTYRGNNETGDFLGGILANGPDLFVDLALDVTLLQFFDDPDNPGQQIIGTDILPPDVGFPAVQSETITTNGGQSQFNISYGGNYLDKVYVGVGLGIASIDYRRSRLYTEAPTETVLDFFTIQEDQNISGTGVNLNLGLMVRPIDQVLIGVNYVTPTFYSLTEGGEIDIFADFFTESFSSSALIADYDFNLRTPGRLSGGLTVFLGKNGFLTAQVESLDYTNARLSSNFDVSPENDFIRGTYTNVLNYNLGAEIRLDELRLRAGYGLQADPYVSGIDDVDRSITRISAGAGLHKDSFFVDLAIVNSTFNSTINPYPGAPFAQVENNNTEAVVTLGFKF